MKTSFSNVTLNELDTTASNIIEAAQDHTLWCFHGEMGAGKTTLIKAICKALRVTDEITSPTFSLVNEYRASNGKTIYHFDFYRIKSLEEVYDIGYEDYFFSGNTCLIEWPEKIEALLEGETFLKIHIGKSSETSRTITLS